MEYKEKIMQEFMQQFVQKDCRDIKVDNIAENLGISKRTLYEIFPSKDEMIKQTLHHYQSKNQEKLLAVWSGEKNPLVQILKISYAIIDDTNQISIARLLHLKKQYPEIAVGLMAMHARFMKNVMLKSYENAQKEGLIFPEVEPEFLLALLASGEKDPRQRTFTFMGKEFDVMKLFAAHLFTIIRGVSTFKGVEICDTYYYTVLKDKIER
ncbi:MAG: TetR/AcrR family transcriptional regulator [Bacteroidales bacterium]|nr:TetR/AcrR family transcriptional regulator [Bacteroidales bacterium]